MGGLVVILIPIILFIIDSQKKKNLMAYYDERINQASVVGDTETANRLINAKSAIR